MSPRTVDLWKFSRGWPPCTARWLTHMAANLCLLLVEGLISLHNGPSIGLLECLHDMWLASLRVSDPRKRSGWKLHCHLWLSLHSSTCHFHCMTLCCSHRPTIQCRNSKKCRSLGLCWRLTTL
jgi:hypothetical protein